MPSGPLDLASMNNLMDTVLPAGEDPRYAWLGLDLRVDGVPLSLQALNQWVLWRAVPKERGAGRIKVPYQPNGAKASSTDPKTWSDFGAVLAAYREAQGEPNGYAGIGFCLTAQDAFFALDYDHVRNPHTGEIDPGVSSLINWVGTYAEISPSGTGIRIIGRGVLGRSITTSVLQAWDHGHYITITGHRLQDAPTDIREVSTDALESIRAYWTGVQADRAETQGFAVDRNTRMELRAALHHIPADDYELWIAMGHALHELGNIGRGLWLEWSQSSEKYDAKVAGEKWRSFKPRDTSYKAVFARAEQCGWINPASREAMAFEQSTGMSLEEANRAPPEPVVFEAPPAAVRPFPVHGLDEVAAWVGAMAEVEYPVITQQAVLAIVGAAVSRTYATPQGDPLSLYLGCCGRSIGELRYAQHAIAASMSAAGLRRMVRVTRMTSPATIYKTLLRSPACLYLSDDYGGVAAFSRRQPSGLQEHALSLITSIYDGKPIQLDGPEDAGLRPGSGQVSDEQPVIYAPCLSVLALIGDDQLASLMRQSETGRGALQQMLIAIGDERAATVKDPQDVPPPPWLANYLRRLRRVPGAMTGADLSLSDIFSAASGLPPMQTTVPFAAPLDPVYRMLDALSDDRRSRSLLLAGRGIVRRIAAALAAWESPDNPVVSQGILDWAGAYVAERLRETVERFSFLHGDDGRLSVYDHVLAYVLDAGTEGIQPGNLPARCKPFRNLSGEKRGELINQMLKDEVVVEISARTQGRGRPSRRLVAAKFVKKEG